MNEWMAVLNIVRQAWLPVIIKCQKKKQLWSTILWMANYPTEETEVSA